MAKLASIELNADQDVTKGMKISIIPLFLRTDLWQECQLLENVQADKTRLKVTIAKVASFQTKANVTKKNGEKASCALLFKSDDFARKITTTDDIKKGEKLTVTLETF